MLAVLARKKLLVSLFVVLAIFLFSASEIKAQVVINEFSSNSNPEWVELYNAGSGDLDLTGWKLSDETNSPKAISGTIVSYGYFVFENSQGWLNNSGGDSVILRDASATIIDSVTYGKSDSVVGTPDSDKSAGRVPDNSSVWQNNLLSTKGVSNPQPVSTPTPTPIPTSSATPEPTSTPTSTPTPTPSATKATYKINDVKDENGNTLSSVQIYIDNIYVHHYAAETITFCDGCSCDGYVACGLGSHTITLQKTGYNNWAEAKTLNSGNNYEVNPVMQVSSSTASSTPTPKPTPFASPATSFSASSSSKVIATGLSLVLGESVASTASAAASEKPDDQPKPQGKSNLLTPLFLILGALAVLGTGLSIFWLKRKKGI